MTPISKLLRMRQDAAERVRELSQQEARLGKEIGKGHLQVAKYDKAIEQMEKLGAVARKTRTGMRLGRPW